MSLVLVYSCVWVGVNVFVVCIEVMFIGGLLYIQIVGLFVVVVCELCDCVCVVLFCVQFEFLQWCIIINLVLVDLFKEGGCFDFVIVLGIFVVSGQIDLCVFDGYEFFGEFVLIGELCGVDGVLFVVFVVVVEQCVLVVVLVNVVEVVFVVYVDVCVVCILLEVCVGFDGWLLFVVIVEFVFVLVSVDLCDVCGQYQVCCVFEVVVVGVYYLLLFGMFGCGKILLVLWLFGILFLFSDVDVLEIVIVVLCSVYGIDLLCWCECLFCVFYYIVSVVLLVGGGLYLCFGEILFVYNGVFFFDELFEWSCYVLEVLCELLEFGYVVVIWVVCSEMFFVCFQLIVVMNFCFCGWVGDCSGCCCCSVDVIVCYCGCVFGLLLDCIDLYVDVL